MVAGDSPRVTNVGLSVARIPGEMSIRAAAPWSDQKNGEFNRSGPSNTAQYSQTTTTEIPIAMPALRRLRSPISASLPPHHSLLATQIGRREAARFAQGVVHQAAEYRLREMSEPKRQNDRVAARKTRCPDDEGGHPGNGVPRAE